MSIDQLLGLGILACQQQAADLSQVLCGIGRSASCGAPGHSELSFSTMRSWAAPPKSIAPNRPLPSGNDSVNSLAGVLNQISRSDDAPEGGIAQHNERAQRKMPKGLFIGPSQSWI